MEKKKSKLKSLVDPEEDYFNQIGGQNEAQDESSEGQETKKIQLPPMMAPNTMAGGILLIDAIGKEARIEFMTGKSLLGGNFILNLLLLQFNLPC